ncbi:conserved hypothetical protein [Crenothrix polyspora]|uniref:Uncharacterized protein n=1 Tax=Crenothrix polyspora TaxID=360316 RepID=A0A1R4HCG8_9GAMM|nr:hypothetical protein [Crenothrix polyspora]SJM93913.1 conserved hypothetical protein [Crenothrix polyspora]
MQGDVLERTQEINKLLQKIHPHFYDNSKNLFFMVLTQSCDLVKRGKGEKCKAPYITIVPVRSLDLVFSKHLSQLGCSNVEAELPVMTNKSKGKASEFLQRLFNNNEPGYFFLESESTPLSEDCVAFLNLSIAIKADIHYDKCLAAKVLELNDTFQAKLGWLVGQMYSRVGTPDWEEPSIKKKTDGLLNNIAIWVEDDKIKALEAGYKSFRDSNPDKKMTKADVSQVIKKVPTRKKQALEQVEKIIRDTLGQDENDKVAKLRKRLENDAALTNLLK